MNEQLGYGYDASHNLAARTNHTLLQTFTSDSRNQLSTIIRSGTLTVAGSVTGAVATLGVNGTWAEIYSDQTFATTNGLTLQDGNNLFVTAGSNASGTLVLSTKEARTLPVTVGFSYDLNGNLLSDGVKGYEYDDANQLVRVTVTNGWKAEFAYDGLGRRRVAKDYSWSGASWTLTNEVRYVWDGMVVLQERDGSNNPQVSYTFAAGRRARTTSSETAFYQEDNLGSETALVNVNGTVLARNPIHVAGT